MKVFISIIFSFFVLTWPLMSAAVAEEIVLIVNNSYPASDMSIAEIKKIYRGEKQFEGKFRIKPVDQKDISVIKQKFVEKILGLSVNEYRGYWLKRVFKMGDMPPVVRSNPREVIETIVQQDGSVGYVWSGEVQGTKSIKVIATLTVDGPD